MREQKFCGKCGKTNWSQWFETCECKEPDFQFDTHDEYLEFKRKQETTQSDVWNLKKEIERVIADLENRLKIVEEAERKTQHAKSGQPLLENMFASGSKEALKYAISELRAVIAH